MSYKRFGSLRRLWSTLLAASFLLLGAQIVKAEVVGNISLNLVRGSVSAISGTSYINNTSGYSGLVETGSGPATEEAKKMLQTDGLQANFPWLFSNYVAVQNINQYRNLCKALVAGHDVRILSSGGATNRLLSRTSSVNNHCRTGISFGGSGTRRTASFSGMTITYGAAAGGTNTPAGNGGGGGGGGGGGVDPGGNGGGGGGGAPAEPQYEQGTLVAAGAPSPSAYASEALDTSNFLSSDRYSWAADVWQTMRQMSNILIIVFLFVGALATTLNYNLNTYGVKRIIPSVVQAAIISNFSYVLINALIEVIGITQQGLLGLGVSGSSATDSTWSQLAAPLTSILDQIEPNNQTTAGGLIFGLIAALAVAFAMLLLWVTVGILMLRSVVLSLLICFAPLAILSMALPATQSLWQKWWSEFAKWLFIPLIVCFWLMVAGVINGIATLPIYLKLIAMMFAIWQGVKAPFSFKPAIMGAAIGAATGYIAGAGTKALNSAKSGASYTAQRAWYSNDVTGGLTRAWQGRSQRMQQALSQAKDPKVAFRGQNRIAARLNAVGAGREMSLQVGQTRMETNAARARGHAHRSRAGSALARASLDKEQWEENEKVAKAQATRRAMEADPDRLERIAALQETQESVNNIITGMRDVAKTRLDESLRAEKKATELFKQAAADRLKVIQGQFDLKAETEGSSAGQGIKAWLKREPAIRQSLQNMGVNIAADGSGYKDGLNALGMQAQAITDAAESEKNKQKVGRARIDLNRHNRVDLFRRDGHRDVAAIQGQLGSLTREERVGLEEHLSRSLSTTYGMSEESLLQLIRSGPTELANAIAVYNNTDDGAQINGVAISAGMAPNAKKEHRAMAERVKTGEALRRAMVGKERGLVAEADKKMGEGMVTDLPTGRVMSDLSLRLAPNAAAINAATTPELAMAANVLTSFGKPGENGVSLDDATHYDVANLTRLSLKTLHQQALGQGGQPNLEAINAFIDTLYGAGDEILQKNGGALPPPGPLLDAYQEIDRVSLDLMKARTALTDAVAAEQAASTDDEIAAANAKRTRATSMVNKALRDNFLTTRL